MSTRRHETTIDGVTAWAERRGDILSGWTWEIHTSAQPQACVVMLTSLPDGGWSLLIARDGRFMDGRDATRAVLLVTLGVGVILPVVSAVLAEAAQIAQGGEVPE